MKEGAETVHTRLQQKAELAGLRLNTGDAKGKSTSQGLYPKAHRNSVYVMELVKNCKSLGVNSLHAIYFVNNPPSRAVLYKRKLFTMQTFFTQFFSCWYFLKYKNFFFSRYLPTQIYSSGTYRGI